MPTFRCTTLDASAGAPAGGLVIEAPDRASALRQVIARGLTPLRVEEMQEQSRPAPRGSSADAQAASRASTAAGGVSRSSLTGLIRDLATAVNAGLPLVQSLRTIARSGRSPAEAAMLARLIDEVEHGRSLSEAMASVGRPFTELVISLVRAGETAGRLGEVLTQAARLLDRDAKLRRSMLGALLYPLIIAAAVTLAVIIVVTVIVPRVLAAVAGQLAVLPWPTRVVQGIASFVGSWWWLILIVLAVAAVAFVRAYRTPSVRLSIDRTLLRLPAVGTALRIVAVARFTRTLATLIGAGLPVVASLRITRATLGNRELELAIDRVCDQVQAGRTIAEPLEQSGLFPPLLVQIVGLGEQTGRLGEVLDQAAQAFEDQTEQSVKILTTVLPPILIIALACVVGFVVLSILLPLIELQESIG